MTNIIKLFLNDNREFGELKNLSIALFETADKITLANDQNNIYPALQAWFKSEIRHYGNLNDSDYQTLYNKISTWNPIPVIPSKKLKKRYNQRFEVDLIAADNRPSIGKIPEELRQELIAESEQKYALVQSAFLQKLTRLLQERENIRLGNLKTLLNCLKLGKTIFERKIAELEQKSDSLKKIETLKTILGDEEPVWKKIDSAATLEEAIASISAYIPIDESEQMNAGNPAKITETDYNNLINSFSHLIKDIILPVLNTMNKEETFIHRIQRWASDTLKAIFGYGFLSTQQTLFNLAKTKHYILNRAEKSSHNPEITLNSSLNRGNSL